jgi:alpha-glucosidase
LGLDPFYEKYADAKGIAVISSKNVPDEALVMAAELILHVLANRADLHRVLIASNARIVVIGKREATTDVPEYSNLKPKDHWDNRTRGLGGNQTTSCGEENLLGYEDDRYCGESILIHEFAHTVHGLAMRIVDEGFDDRLKTLYEKAMAKGLWKQTYAATNHHEYWAEGVQSYFDCNLEAEPPDGIHNHVRTRQELQKYDPDLFKLIDEVFAENPWRWTPTGAHQRKWKKKESGSLPMGNSVGHDPQQDLKNKSKCSNASAFAARWGQSRRGFAAAPALCLFR